MAHMEYISKNETFSAFHFLLISSAIFMITWYAQFRWNRRNMYKLAAKIPDVNTSSLPIIGVGHHFIGNMHDILNVSMKLCSRNTTCKGWGGHKLMCVVYKPEDLEIVLNSKKCLAKQPDAYKSFKILLGEGLIAGEVPIWKIHRKAIDPTFNQINLNKFIGTFSDKANILVEVLKDRLDETYDITNRLTLWGIDSICNTAIGLDIHAQTSDSKVVTSLHRVMDICADRIVNLLHHSDFIFKLSSVYRNNIHFVHYIKEYVDEIIQTKIKAHKENMENKESPITEQSKFKSFIDLFLELTYEQETFTNEELRDEVNTIFVAGADTSKSTVGFVLMMLGMFPDVQQKVYDEVIDVLGHDRPVNHTDLGQFPYLNRVIKETMRIFPLIPFLGRDIQDDLEITDYTLPKGAGLVIAVIMVHRSADYWVDPLKFDPDRFLPEEMAKRHPYAYIPFSGGARNCLGQRYAMMSMKTVLPTLIRRYKVESPYTRIEDIDCTQNLLIKPKNGYLVKFSLRD